MRSNRREVMKSIPQIDQQGFVPRDTSKCTSNSYKTAQAKIKYQILVETLSQLLTSQSETLEYRDQYRAWSIVTRRSNILVIQAPSLKKEEYTQNLR